jgi:hypothetical protein
LKIVVVVHNCKEECTEKEESLQTARIADGKQQSKEPARERRERESGKTKKKKMRQESLPSMTKTCGSQQTSTMMTQKARRGKAQHFW